MRVRVENLPWPHPYKTKNNHKWLFLLLLVRVRVVETLSQVWKTCILTAVLHPQFTIHELKSFRLVFSPSEALLLIERARKNAKMEDFGQKFGVGYRD